MDDIGKLIARLNNPRPRARKLFLLAAIIMVAYAAALAAYPQNTVMGHITARTGVQGGVLALALTLSGIYLAVRKPPPVEFVLACMPLILYTVGSLHWWWFGDGTPVAAVGHLSVLVLLLAVNWYVAEGKHNGASH